ncbi:hypothetical protein [Thiohalobacter sp.]|uniref:hypothetical protein n=1 Tax=Thiohalobacter sp. TaxID=2025948 RepID=UPI002610AC82|nr:hypothetical protein [Thiohalobacter sp.]
MAVSVALLVGSQSAVAQQWVKNIDAATYNATGTITFDDWGYVGPGGRTYNDTAPLNGGFGGPAEGNNADPAGGISQIQHVVTRAADGLTPDGPQTLYSDFGAPSNTFTDANLDTQVNFYKWGYTTKPGSTFNNMRIDYDGDYLVRQEDMTFQFYDVLSYQQELGADGVLDPNAPPDGTYNTGLAFQPYALSDAIGWCGSVMASNPAAQEAMGGMVTFDFAFDVYSYNFTTGQYTYFSTEIVRGFKMTSFGEFTVNVSPGAGGYVQQFSSRAVVNNTNPNDVDAVAAGLASGTAPTDANFYNLVSFHGADVLSVAGKCGVLTAEWAAGQRGEGVYKFSSLLDYTDRTSCEAAGGSWQNASFPGFAFIMRADGIRVIDAMDYSVYSDLSNVPNTDANGVAYNYDENGNLVAIADLSAVPVPAAVWLFGSGLVGLLGVARRRRARV